MVNGVNINELSSQTKEAECEILTFYLEPVTLTYVPNDLNESSESEFNGEQYFVTDAPVILFDSNCGVPVVIKPDVMLPYLSCTSRAPVLGQVTEQAPFNHKIEIKEEPTHEMTLSPRIKTRSKNKTLKCKKENVNLDLKQIQVNYRPVPKRRASYTKPKIEVKSKTITDYFPSQRSKRKTSVMIQKEKLKEFEEAILSGVEEGFEVQETREKGRCVVTNKKIKKGDFVLEYCGDLISIDEAKCREQYYASIENVGCYMYYFMFQNRQYCIDATKESHRLGRLVNHSKKGNMKTKPFLVENTPHLILVADRDIQPGEELLYDYGDRSKRSLEYYPWLAT